MNLIIPINPKATRICPKCNIHTTSLFCPKCKRITRLKKAKGLIK